MKKSFLTVAVLMVASAIHAQMLDFKGMPPYMLGVTAGVNMPSFSAPRYDYSIGVQGGLDLVMSTQSLLPNTHLRAQLKYSMKGATGPEIYAPGSGDGEYTYPMDSYKVYFTTHYIELPIHFGYGWRIDRDWTLLAETGPYFAFGMGGTGREKGRLWTESHSFFNYYDACRFDYGWGVQASLVYNQQLMFNVGYDWGFKNMTPGFLQNTNLSMGLTYFFDYRY